MIKKMLTLKNVGRFTSVNFSKGNWNGAFEDLNVIYANNGLGKTTLSIIFDSLSGSNNMLNNKKSFLTSEPIEIKFIDENNKEIKYTNKGWNNYVSNIEVFNTFFIEDNIYVINTLSISKGRPEFELVYGKDNYYIQQKSIEVDKKLEVLRSKRKRIRRQMNNDKLTNEDIRRFEEQIKQSQFEAAELSKEKLKLRHNATALSDQYKEEFIKEVNKYLIRFNPELEITELKQKSIRMAYGLKVKNADVALESKQGEKGVLRFVLSEGDKSSLAFAFFLAKLELSKDKEKKLIVIDDPVSSYDYSRKNTTINILYKLSQLVKKMIVLTHDINFANDFSKYVNYKCQNLKIIDEKGSSQIVNHNIKEESYVGIFKDLQTLKKFIEFGTSSEADLREVIRCIRPVLEGFIRIKFFGDIEDGEWLGDIIKKMREAAFGAPFSVSHAYLDELEEINNYCKSYHHSAPYYSESNINSTELKAYCTRTIQLIRNL